MRRKTKSINLLKERNKPEPRQNLIKNRGHAYYLAVQKTVLVVLTILSPPKINNII